MATSPVRRTRIARLAAALALTTTLSACSIEDLVGDLCSGVGPVASVQIAPRPISLRSGDSVQVVASQRDSKGSDTMLCTSVDVSWSSASTTIATVRGDRGGATVVAVAPGQTSISAVAGSKSATVSVVVTAR